MRIQTSDPPSRLHTSPTRKNRSGAVVDSGWEGKLRNRAKKMGLRRGGLASGLLDVRPHQKHEGMARTPRTRISFASANNHQTNVNIYRPQITHLARSPNEGTRGGLVMRSFWMLTCDVWVGWGWRESPRPCPTKAPSTLYAQSTFLEPVIPVRYSNPKLDSQCKNHSLILCAGSKILKILADADPTDSTILPIKTKPARHPAHMGARHTASSPGGCAGCLP